MTLFLTYKRQMPLLLALFTATFWSEASRAQEQNANQSPGVLPAAEIILTATNHQTTDERVIIAQNERPKAAQENPDAARNAQPPVVNGDNARNNRPRTNSRQQRLEEELRRAMSSLGCVDASVQDAVLEYIREETKARRPLLEQSRRLFFTLRTSTQVAEPKKSAQSLDPASPLGGMPEDEPVITRTGNYAARPALSKEQLENEATLASQIVAYRAALDADRTRHKASEAALDSKIKFSQNPRLEAMLLLMGIIGDSPNLPLRAGIFGAGPARPPAPRNNPPAAPVPNTQDDEPEVMQNPLNP